MPDMHEVLDKLVGKRYYWSVDVSSYYWQIPIDDESKPRRNRQKHLQSMAARKTMQQGKAED
jgi:hypothetical protein